MDIKNKNAVAAEILLEPLFRFADLNPRFLRLPLYPAIIRDISLAAKEDIGAGQLLEVVRKGGAGLLRGADIVDWYRGAQIPAGSKGWTISCVYRADERTLTEEEINPIHGAILSELEGTLGVQIRR